MQSRGSQQDGQLALQPPLQLPTLLSRGAAQAASEAGGGGQPLLHATLRGGKVKPLAVAVFVPPRLRVAAATGTFQGPCNTLSVFRADPCKVA